MIEAPSISSRKDPRLVAVAVSFSVSFCMLAGKMTAYFVTGSAAILSDAAESVIHLFATAFVGFSLWYAFQPADTEHPYGHGKIAYLASGVEGILIFVAAISIIYLAIEDLLRGPSLSRLDKGLWILIVLTLINLALGLYLIKTGKKYNNLILVSNGQHVLTDMWTSIGVVVGVFLVWLTDVLWLDPVVAILVALNILWTAGKLLKRAAEGLMEKVLPEQTALILSVLERAKDTSSISQFHQLRHRRIHDQIWVDYHLLFPPALSIVEAHRRSHEVEKTIQELFPKYCVFVTAHLEPDEHAGAHPEAYVEPTDPLQNEVK